MKQNVNREVISDPDSDTGMSQAKITVMTHLPQGRKGGHRASVLNKISDVIVACVVNTFKTLRKCNCHVT